MRGRIVGALVLGRVISRKTKQTVGYLVQELHSTKGWKPRYSVPASRFPWAPSAGVFCWADGCGPQRKIDDVQPVIPERMLLRHGWYRRKLRKEAELARNSPDV
jgi:hypothetical protein